MGLYVQLWPSFNVRLEYVHGIINMGNMSTIHPSTLGNATEIYET